MQNESCDVLVKLPEKHLPDLNYSFLAQRIELLGDVDVYTTDLHSTRLVYFTEELPTLNTEEFPIFAGRSLLLDFNLNTKYETKVGEDCWIVYITDKKQLIEDYYGKKVNLCKQHIGRYLGFRNVGGAIKPAYAVGFNSLSVSSGDLDPILADVFHITFDPYFFTVNILTEGVVAIDGQTIYNRDDALHHRKNVRIKTETIDSAYITADTVFRAEDNDPYTDIILQYPTGGYGGSSGSSSIWLTGDPIFAITGSPVIGSGTFTLNFANENANYGFYGPASGSATTPTFRAMVTNDITNNIVTDAKLRQSAALSVIGRYLNSTGNVADISASAGTSYVLIESASTLIWGQTQTATYANSSVTFAKIQNIPAATLIGRYSGTTGVPQILYIGTGLVLTSDTISASGGYPPAGSNYYIQYYDGGVFGADVGIRAGKNEGTITLSRGNIGGSGTRGLDVIRDESTDAYPPGIRFGKANGSGGSAGSSENIGSIEYYTDSSLSGLIAEIVVKTTASGNTYGEIDLRTFNAGTGASRLKISENKIGVFAATPVVKQTVTGNQYGNTALTSFLTAMANFGWITDSTTVGVAAVPGGVNGDIQFNNSGAFGGATGVGYRTGGSPSTLAVTGQTGDSYAFYVDIGAASATCELFGPSGVQLYIDDTVVRLGHTTAQIGFFGVTPVSKPSGAAQAAVVTTAATNVAPWGYTTQAQADAIITLLNEIRNVLVSEGLMKGSA